MFKIIYFNKEAELTQQCAYNEKELKRIRKEVEIATANYNLMKETLETKLNKLETETALFMAENAKFVDEISLINPGYELLCKEFADKSKDYDEVRKKLLCNILFQYYLVTSSSFQNFKNSRTI